MQILRCGLFQESIEKKVSLSEKISLIMDIGTAYSCVGVFQQWNAEIITSRHGTERTLSYIAAIETEILTVDAVKSNVARNPVKVVSDSKRLIGRTLDAQPVVPDIKQWHCGDDQLKLVAEYIHEHKTFQEEILPINKRAETCHDTGYLNSKEMPGVCSSFNEDEEGFIVDTEKNAEECEVENLHIRENNTELDDTMQKQFMSYLELRYLFCIVLYLTLCCPNTAVSNNSETDLIKLSNCSLPLTECPRDKKYKYREMCINNFMTDKCPPDSTYLCGIDSEEHFIIEICQNITECWPGTALTFEVNPHSREITLACLPCRGKRFETEYTLSSLSSNTNSCTYQHKDQDSISQHLVLVSEGTKSSATTWYCNAEYGFCERNGWMTCDDIPSHPCECVGKTCLPGLKLRPDGKCVRCHTRLNPKDNWRCEDHVWASTTDVPPVTSTVSFIRPTKLIISLTTGGPNRTKNNTKIIRNLTTHIAIPSSSKANEDTSHNTSYSSDTSAGSTQVALLAVLGVGIVTVIGFAVLIVIICCFRNQSDADSNISKSLESPVSNGNSTHQKAKNWTIHKTKNYYNTCNINAKNAHVGNGNINNIKVHKSAKKTSRKGKKTADEEEQTSSIPEHLRMKEFPSTPLLGNQEDEDIDTQLKTVE